MIRLLGFLLYSWISRFIVSYGSEVGADFLCWERLHLLLLLGRQWPDYLQRDCTKLPQGRQACTKRQAFQKELEV